MGRKAKAQPAIPYIDKSGDEPVLVFPDGTYPPCPRGFPEAYLKCFPPKFGDQDLPWRLEVLHDFAKGKLPEGRDEDCQFEPLGMTAHEFWAVHVQETKQAVNRALESNDSGFFKRLIARPRAKGSKRPHGCTAEALAIAAFFDLLKNCGTHFEWPTKKQLRSYVDKHFPDSATDRHWRRLFANTWLKELPSDI